MNPKSEIQNINHREQGNTGIRDSAVGATQWVAQSMGNREYAPMHANTRGPARCTHSVFVGANLACACGNTQFDNKHDF